MEDMDDADDVAEQEKPVHASAKPWHDKLKSYREKIDNKWKDQRTNLDKLYSKDERSDVADREYAIFWANIEVLKPAVYMRPPVPVVAPRFRQTNPVASSASDILERCLITTFEQSDLHGCMREVRDEFLRYSRGTAWARLSVGPGGVERVEFDHVGADDYAHDPARTWREVKWIARRSWLTRERGKERFDQYLQQYGKTFDNVPVKRRDETSSLPDPKDEAPVWEIWDLETRQVYWVNEDYDCILDQQPPWLDLSTFWPCPKPAFGTLVPKKLLPVPDIRQYKDQLEEINEYTARIAALSQALKVRGFYPAGTGELSEAIEAAIKNLDNRATLIPVSSYAALGGASFKDSIVWLPVDQILETIKGLVELRRVVIDDVYQITGISDIVRGQTEASETATAQQIKSQWGSLRIRERQTALVEFARDMTRIAGEIIAENFSPQTITAMAQMQTVLPEQMQQVMAFLSDDKARGFTIEIETDSTIQPDEDAEKQRRVEFVTAVGGLFQQAAPIVMQAPQLGPFMGEVLKFAAQGFRAGRPLEGAIDQMVQMLGQMAQQATQPQQPSPEQQMKVEESKAKLEATKAQTQAKVVGAQADMAKTQLDMVASQQQHAMGMEKMAAEAAMPPERVN